MYPKCLWTQLHRLQALAKHVVLRNYWHIKISKGTSKSLKKKMSLAQCEGIALFVCSVDNRITYHSDGAKLSPA